MSGEPSTEEEAIIAQFLRNATAIIGNNQVVLSAEAEAILTTKLSLFLHSPETLPPPVLNASAPQIAQSQTKLKLRRRQES